MRFFWKSFTRASPATNPPMCANQATPPPPPAPGSDAIPLKSWMELRAKDTVMKVKLLDNIQASATEVRPEEVYLCRYPISNYPRLLLMGFGVDLEQALPCKKGDALLFKKIEKEEKEEGDAETPDPEKKGNEKDNESN